MTFKKNCWGYWEVDCFNVEENKTKVLKILQCEHESDYASIYFKNGDRWVSRSSGMTFNISGMFLYTKLKELLDKEFSRFILNYKLKKVKTTSR